MLNDAINTHYLNVRGRIKALNPGRGFGGVMQAQDWPPKDVLLEAFYCLILGFTPLGKQAYSAAIPVVVHTVQWTWMVVGTDVQKTIQTRSRGDRYQTHFQMKGELLNGNYPGFAPKLSVSVDGAGNLVGTPIVPSESIVWSPVAIVDRNEKSSGLLYGVGTVRITDMTDLISS